MENIGINNEFTPKKFRIKKKKKTSIEFKTNKIHKIQQGILQEHVNLIKHKQEKNTSTENWLKFEV